MQVVEVRVDDRVTDLVEARQVAGEPERDARLVPQELVVAGPELAQ